MAITLKDVASVAGVSTATVSRALAGSDKVAPRTADHVKEIASSLGYRFDNVARALRQKRSNLIGFVAADFSVPYVQELLIALDRELYLSEFVLAATSSFRSVDHEFVQVARLLGQRIDALLIVPVDDDKSCPAVNIAIDEDTPVIQLHQGVANPQTALVRLDYDSGIDCALRFLRKHQVNSITYLDTSGDFAAKTKRDALFRAIDRHSFDSFSVHTNGFARVHGDIEDETGHARGKLPDAIICNDYISTARMLQARSELADSNKVPIVVCLDKIPGFDQGINQSVISVEFSMVALASILVGQIVRALNKEMRRENDLRLQSFLNLSRF